MERSDNSIKLEKLLGDGVIEKLSTRQHFCMEMGDGKYFMVFKYCNINALKEKEKQVCVYCDKENFLVVTEHKQCNEIYNKIHKTKSTYSQLLAFLSELIDDDIEVLEDIEDNITALEDALLISGKPMKKTVTKIVDTRRKLLRVKRYYNELLGIVEVICDSDDKAIDDSLINRYETLERRLSQLVEYSQNMMESVSQVRETYQAQIDIEQNKLMKIFTVITTIFMPLTLIVGWYGMNFENMPELSWEHGYLYVILLSVAVSVGSYLVFKIKKWFK